MARKKARKTGYGDGSFRVKPSGLIEYRFIYKDEFGEKRRKSISATTRQECMDKQFARMSTEVWGIDPAGKSEEELAAAFVDALEAFIREIGLPSSFAEMGITDADFKAIADTTILTGGCAKKFSREELLEVLEECK